MTQLPDKLQLRLPGTGLKLQHASRAIEVFHGWISQRKLDDVLVDVADYRHVVDGPGLVLVGSRANYMLETSGHRAGLSCFRKGSGGGSAARESEQDPLRDVLELTLRASQLLQEALGDPAVRFDVSALELCVVDRRVTDHGPFAVSELARDVGERLARLFATTPTVTTVENAARPTLVASWTESASPGHILTRLQGGRRRLELA